MAMNLFRLAGDMTHLLSIIVLLLKINATRSCRGERTAGGDLNRLRLEATLRLGQHAPWEAQ